MILLTFDQHMCNNDGEHGKITYWQPVVVNARCGREPIKHPFGKTIAVLGRLSTIDSVMTFLIYKKKKQARRATPLAED